MKMPIGNCVHAPTLADARKICHMANLSDLMFNNGDIPGILTHWEMFEKDTCYNVFDGRLVFQSLSWYKRHGVTPITPEEFYAYNKDLSQKV